MNFFSTLVKKTRILLWALREKSPVEVDEYELEHLLLYHGLIGTSPDNQREWKDVKADIHQAIRSKSPEALAIALKLQPLWWQEKLAKIFDQITTQESTDAIDILLAGSDEIDQNNRASSPLNHEDWRVRANTAAILAHLKVEKAAEPLGVLLDDTTESGSLSFCHIAYALGRLGSEAAKSFLIKHINDVDAWRRVDAVAALACYPFHSVANSVAEALLMENELKDYMAVALCKQHQPKLFFTFKAALPESASLGANATDESLKDWVAKNPDYSSVSEERRKEAGAAVILGLIDASEHTFTDEVLFETNITECLDPSIDLAVAKPDPIAIAASLLLINWLLDNRQTVLERMPNFAFDQLQIKKDAVTNAIMQESIIDYLRQHLTLQQDLSAETLLQLKQAVFLAGQLHLEAAENILVARLLPDANLLDETIIALGLIGRKSSLPSLLKLGNNIVDRNERNARAKSKQPVVEDDSKKSTTYWNILKALANFPEEESALFLLEATQDFAPDKRAQAVSSLAHVLAKRDAKSPGADIDKVIGEALDDKSSLVQIAALSAALELHKGVLIPQISRLLDAQENAVSKHALSTLFALSSNGYKSEVLKVLQERSKKERQEHKKKRIDEFLALQGAV